MLEPHVKEEFDYLLSVILEASTEIMDVYQSDFAIEDKDDGSPLTEADKRSNEVICRRLEEYDASIPILSEELAEIAYEDRKDWTEFWCVDPLDGTKEFTKRNGEFAINLALIENGEPVLGFIYVSVLGYGYYARKGHGCYKINTKHELERLNPLPRAEFLEKRDLNLIGSRSHSGSDMEAFTERMHEEYGVVNSVRKGSSLKFGAMVEGIADLYVRLSPCMEWDTAAGHAIVREAGMDILRVDDKKPLAYNKENLLTPFFICGHKDVLESRPDLFEV